MKDILEKIESVSLARPEDQIIAQIRGLIRSGALKPGDRLPSERHLAEKFGLGRGYVRRALQKLDFYGIVRTHHQSGSYVSNMGLAILDGLLSNILTLEDADMVALVESRMLIEVETAGLAAARVTPAAMVRIRDAFDKYAAKISQHHDAMEEDVLFHIRIAECAGNPVLRTMIMILAQDIIKKTRAIDGCEGDRKHQALNEHATILAAIEAGLIDEAKEAMRLHLQHTRTFPCSEVPTTESGVTGLDSIISS